MKKLMFYINNLEYGGAERVIANLANRFSATGCEVVFVTTYRAQREYPLSGEIRRVVLSQGENIGRIRRNILLISRLRSAIKAEKPDVLVSFMGEPNMRAIVAALGVSGVKKVISVRNDPYREYPGTATRLLAKLLYRFADGTVFQTEDARGFFPRGIQKKSRIIFNQVADTFFDAAGTEAECRDVIAVGRLAKQKNFEMLIRAFGKICHQTQENLVIYGEGPEREPLEALIRELSLEERVFLPGATDQVIEKLQAARLFVLSSDYEGMPNALMEAMAVGKVCISTDCPCGGPRMLTEGISGLLYPVGDEEQLREKLLWALSLGEQERKKISSRIRTKAECFRSDRVFGQWEEYLQAVAEGNR